MTMVTADGYVVLDVLADSPQVGPAQLEKLMQDPKAAAEEGNRP